MKVQPNLLPIGVRHSRSLRAFDASIDVNTSTGLILLPSWLTIQCATTGRTSQRSASMLKTGYGANAARARNVGSGEGLSVESARTNLITGPTDGATLTAFGVGGSVTSVNSLGDPAGGNGATLLGYGAAGNNGAYTQPLTQLAINHGGVNSFWLMNVSGTLTIQAYDVQAGAFSFTKTTTANWARYDGLCGNVHALTTVLGIGNQNSGAGVAGTSRLWGWQVEQDASYPGSLIDGARAQDILTADPASVAPGGYFNLDFTIAPNYAQSEFTADHNLVYFNANNRIYVKQSDQTFRLRLGGSDTASGALTWARDDAMRVQARHSEGGKRIVVSKNGTVVYDSGLLAAASAITLPGSVGVLGDTTTTTESADLRSLRILRP